MALSATLQAALWARFGRPRELPVRNEPAWPAASIEEAPYLTVVARLDADAAERLLAALGPLRRAFPQHHHYAAASLHLTVVYLRGLSPGVVPEGLVERLDAAVSVVASFELASRGFGLGSDTVFAAYEVPPALQALRRAIAGVARPESTASDRAASRVAVVNAVRLRDRVEPGLVEHVRAVRRVELAAMRVDRVELVRTDRVMSVVDVVGAWRLGQRSAVPIVASIRARSVGCEIGSQRSRKPR